MGQSEGKFYPADSVAEAVTAAAARISEERQPDSERLVFDPSTGRLRRASPTQSSGAMLFAAVPMEAVPSEYKQDIQRLKDNQDITCKDYYKIQSKHLLGEDITCKDYYKIQSKHRLGEEYERIEVPIWISKSDSDPKPRCKTPLKVLHSDWFPHLDNAIRNINDAAPGLNLTKCTKRSDAKVVIYGTEGGNDAFTRGHINPSLRQKALVCLSDQWPRKKRSSCHELLHALFFQHEHKRSDGTRYLDYESDDYQVVPDPYISGITRFDPFSIMMYGEHESTFTRKPDSDQVWKLKKDGKLNEEMSELDKVALNIIFRPCKGQNYSPNLENGKLWYCGRDKATEKHNRPASRLTDGRCGPGSFPNCPACRVLKNPLLDKIWNEDRWQGWSGFVYCWAYFGVQNYGHDGYCGPNNGPACKDCMKYM